MGLVIDRARSMKSLVSSLLRIASPRRADQIHLRNCMPFWQRPLQRLIVTATQERDNKEGYDRGLRARRRVAFGEAATQKNAANKLIAMLSHSDRLTKRHQHQHHLLEPHRQSFHSRRAPRPTTTASNRPAKCGDGG